jgi:hypothetical protein
MNKKYLLLSCLATIGVVASAVISSYGTVTGYATVSQSMRIDLMGSSNDLNFTENAKQGEIVYSPQIKLDNSASANMSVNITAQISPESAGGEEDVALSFVNEFKNETLQNPVLVTTSDLKFYLMEEFAPNANIGNYSFIIEIVPA